MSSVFFGDVIGVCRGFLMLFFLQHQHPASPIIVSPPHAPVCKSVSLCWGPSLSEGTEEDEFLQICLVINVVFNQEEDTKKLLLTTDRNFHAFCALATPINGDVTAGVFLLAADGKHPL